ncbi:RecT family recombinase [Rossellomorea marisflavi]|uniref:RecT family recombinase n=1 Tax=Rossellomorea marisflavi TaxID=189381 RepID=UPI0025B14106|nr:RecT family recombinase [Rossellomorea marisflavi]WJV19636.1 RecT family recombinase [Rossellomorea marisflavi]
MTRNNQLAPINTKEFENYFSEKELEVVVNSIAKGATNEELALFIQICKQNNLNPFKNHIYFIKYGNQMSIQVSVEGIQYLAQQRDDYKGVTVQLIHENDDFEIGVDPETQELKIEKHSIKIPRGKVAAAYAIAKREGYPDKVVVIEAEEVEHLRTKSGSQWKTYYNDMFKKHALKRALKLQFGIDVDDAAGAQEDNIDPYTPRERKDITPEDLEPESGQEDESEDIKKAWDEIDEKVKASSLTKKDVTDLVKTNFNKKPADLNLSQVTGLSRLVDLKIKEAKKTDAIEMEFNFDEGQLD